MLPTEGKGNVFPSCLIVYWGGQEIGVGAEGVCESSLPAGSALSELPAVFRSHIWLLSSFSASQIKNEAPLTSIAPRHSPQASVHWVRLAPSLGDRDVDISKLQTT